MSDCCGRNGTTDDDDIDANRAARLRVAPSVTGEDQPVAGSDLRRHAAGGDLLAVAVCLGVLDIAQGGAPGLRLPAADLAEPDHRLQLSPGDQSRAVARAVQQPV